MLRFSPDGIAVLQHFESLHDGDPTTPQLEPKLDCRGIPTLGWGAIFDEFGARVTMQTPAIDLDAANRLLARDVGRAGAAVAKLVTVPLTQGEFDALTDFTYNLGGGRLQSSTLRLQLNRGNYDCVPDELRKWNLSGGVKLRGLVLRREAEIKLWNG